MLTIELLKGPPHGPFTAVGQVTVEEMPRINEVVFVGGAYRTVLQVVHVPQNGPKPPTSGIVL